MTKYTKFVNLVGMVDHTKKGANPHEGAKRQLILDAGLTQFAQFGLHKDVNARHR